MRLRQRAFWIRVAYLLGCLASAVAEDAFNTRLGTIIVPTFLVVLLLSARLLRCPHCERTAFVASSWKLPNRCPRCHRRW
jgi:hypothetical protein